MHSTGIIVLITSIFLTVSGSPVQSVEEIIPVEITPTGNGTGNEGRQGLLEIPKLVAWKIRNVIDEGLERVNNRFWTTAKSTTLPSIDKVVGTSKRSVWPTKAPTPPSPTEKPPKAPPPTTKKADKVTNGTKENVKTKAPVTEKPISSAAEEDGTLSPAEIDQYIFLLGGVGVPTTVNPSATPPSIRVTEPLQTVSTSPPVVAVAVTTADYELETEETSVTPFEEDTEVSSSSTLEEDPEETTVSATTADEDEDVDETDANKS